jgi:hypothetical protein
MDNRKNNFWYKLKIPKKAASSPVFDAINGGPEAKDQRLRETIVPCLYKDKENSDFLLAFEKW